MFRHYQNRPLLARVPLVGVRLPFNDSMRLLLAAFCLVIFSMTTLTAQAKHAKSNSLLAEKIENEQQSFIQIAQQEAVSTSTTYWNSPVMNYAYYERNDGIEADSTTNLGCKFKAIEVSGNAAGHPDKPIDGAIWTGGCSVSGHALGSGFLKINYNDGRIEIQKANFNEGIYEGGILVTLYFNNVNNGNGVSLSQATIVDGRAVGSITVIAPNVSLVTNITGYKPPSASNNDDADGSNNDQSQPSEDAQTASGLAQGLSRGINTFQATRAPFVAAEAQRSAAAAQRAQTNAAALALTQQQAALRRQQSAQIQRNSSYSQSATQVSHAQDATHCVRVHGNAIYNTCDMLISVVYCVQGDYSNCNRGYDMEDDIPVGGKVTALPLKTPNAAITVNFAACTGSYTAVAHGMSATCR